jgi:hypothetical protein
MPQFGGVWTAAPTNKRMAPRAIRARPGQFLLSPKPAPGRRGSRVPAAAVAERDLLPLSCARQIGGPATRSTPLTTSTAPSQNMISILASRRSPGKLGRSYPSSRPCMLTIKQQTAARGSSTSPQAGQKPLPLSERSQLTRDFPDTGSTSAIMLSMSPRDKPRGPEEVIRGAPRCFSAPR